MTGMVILDVVIGVVFVYLLLSLLCTAINEWIAGALSLRAKNLRTGVARLLGDPLLQKLVYEHPLITSLKSDSRIERISTIFKEDFGPAADKFLRDPSYLASNRFVGAALDIFFDKKTAADGKVSFVISADLKTEGAFSKKFKEVFGPKHIEAIKKITGADLSSAADQVEAKIEEIRKTAATNLESAIRAVAGDKELSAEAIEERLGEWFDTTMERISGWYKRRMQKISILVGILVAILLNASTTNMAATLAKDQALRASLSAVAQTITAKCTLDQLKDPNNKECGILADAFKSGDGALALPLGWTGGQWPWLPVGKYDLGWFANAFLWLLGIALTGMAASLGAPFWFDLLQKVVRIRSSGAKPATQGESKKEVATR